MPRFQVLPVLAGLVLATAAGCGSGDDGNDARQRGVGEACTTTADCRNDPSTTGDVITVAVLLDCLTEFKGGYCGLRNCESQDQCPEGSVCVVTDAGTNYCFLTCVDKVDCNAHRAVDVEANCTANLSLVDGSKSAKACVPPSGN